MAQVHVQWVSNQANSSKGTFLAALRNTPDRAQRHRENAGGGRGSSRQPQLLSPGPSRARMLALRHQEVKAPQLWPSFIVLLEAALGMRAHG